MLMKMRSRMQNQKGFTLVELMVVVVILGILVAIAVPVYNAVTTKAKISAIEANLRTIDGAVMMYQSNNDGIELADIAVGDDGTGDVDLYPDYIKEWPTSPGTYTVVAGAATVVVGETLDDQVEAATEYTLKTFSDAVD